MDKTGIGIILNENEILVADSGFGMLSNSSDVDTVNQGTITVNSNTSDNSYGMFSLSSSGMTTNSGTINANGRNSIGMASNNGNLTNDGTINLTSTTAAIEAYHSSTAINNGEINITADDGIGVHAINSIVTNSGTININGNNGIGIKAERGSTAINTSSGVINLNGSDGIGIYVSADSNYTNDGTINIAAGTTGNQEIYTEGNAAFINTGNINSQGKFNTNEMGHGDFLMGKVGTIKAESINGDIIIDNSIVQGGFKDTYTSNGMFNTSNLEGNLISNSAMFTVTSEKDKENESYDVHLERRDFKTLIGTDLGRVLENNYSDTENILKEDYYNALKSISTESRLNMAANDTFGVGYFEGIAKQSLDTVKTTRNTIKTNIFSESGNRSLNDIVAIGGVNASTTTIDSSKNFTGYDYDLYSVYFGVDKQVSTNWRLGAIGTVGKGNVDYDNANDKEDDIYQGNLYALYEDKFKVDTMFYLGQMNSDLERNVNFTDWNKQYETSTKTKYLGLDTGISKRFEFNKFYLEPRTELNTVYFRQDGIYESEGASIDKQSYYSIETGIGGSIGRSFLKDKLELQGNFMTYLELGDPYKDQDSKVTSLFKEDKVKINGYKGNDYYSEVGINMLYEVIEPLKLNIGGSYILGEEEDNWNINIGLKYVM